MKPYEFKLNKPKKINKREKTEQILFHLPSETEAFLAALAAVEAYDHLRDLDNTNAILNGGIVSEYVIYLCCHQVHWEFIDETRFSFFSHDHQRKMPLDVEVYMDVDRATNIACTSKRSLAEGFSILIGAELRTIFPKKLRYGSTQMEREYIMLLDFCSPWNGWNDLEALLKHNFGDFKTVRQSKFTMDGYKVRATDVNGMLPTITHCGAVIGVRSAGTYIAAAKRKVLVELSTGTYPNWIGKWDDPYYQLIYDDSHTLKNISPTLVYNVFADEVEKSNLRKRISWPI